MTFIRNLFLLPKKIWRWFLKLSWKKKTAVIVFAVIVLSVVVGQIGALTAPAGYTLAKAQMGDITETVTETGSISANGSSQVFSPATGVVTKVFVSNGSVVSEGQDLLTIESSATEQEQRAAHSNYLAAVASLNAAKSNLNVLRADMYDKWDDFRNLATNDTYETGDGTAKQQEREAAEFQISQDSWLASEAKYKDQQTVVAQASAQVSSTWLLYQATQNATVKATANGTITNLSVTSGSSVNAEAASITEARTPILTIANLTTTEVVVSLSESDITKVKDGQEVVIDVGAVDDKKYKGIVRRVDTIGTDQAGVIRYQAYIEVVNPDDKIRPGMTSDVEIVTNKTENVLTVPNSAVKPYQGGRAVRVVNPRTKEIEYKSVKIGLRGQEKTQILEGIEEGQEVVTSLSNEQLQRTGLF